MRRKPPAVVLVGRPNVGKSTLFNRMTGSRRAIVAPSAGTTRDALERPVVWQGATFELFDTGGLYGASEDPLHELVLRQGQHAITGADLIVMLVDGREGLVPGDEEIAQELRRTGKPVLLAINKTDDKRARVSATDFFVLGFDPVLEISAEHGHGVAELLDEIVKRVAIRDSGVGIRPESHESQIADAEVVALVIDAKAGATDQDAAIGGEADRAGRGVVIVANKWDLVKVADASFAKKFDEELRRRMKFLDYAPILHISALTGERLPKVLEMIDRVAASRRVRVPTPALNRFVEAVTAAHPPVSPRRKHVRILYTAQIGAAPPSFVFFTNVATAFHFSYQRFLVNQLRGEFGFAGTPIRIQVRRRRGPREGPRKG